MASELDKFLAGLGAKQTDPVAEIRQLAKELALGVHKGLWPLGFTSLQNLRDELFLDDENISVFGQRRWNIEDWFQTIERLHGTGYVVNRQNGYITITQGAFDLLREAPPYTVFVSYKHSESSAFALLVVTRLKEFGLQAYCDMRLAPGDPWHPELEDQVKASQFVVLLLGSSTLSSDAVIEEIEWAIDASATVIPITHNGFDYQRNDWEGKVPDAVLNTVERNHRIPIPKEHENAAGYDIAIRTLLVNRFGVSL